MIDFLRFLINLVDGFVPGANILKEVGSRPGYIIYLLELVRNRYNKNVVIVLGLVFIFLICQALMLDVKDMFRLFAHGFAFMLFTSLCLGLTKTSAYTISSIKFGAMTYILVFIITNMYSQAGSYFCEFFSQSCSSHRLKYGLSSEPSYLGIGLIICIGVIVERIHTLHVMLLFLVVIFIIISSKTGLLAITLFYILYYFINNKPVFILGLVGAFVLLAINFDSFLFGFLFDISFQIRGLSSLCGIQMFLSNPFIGVGIGQFSHNIESCTYYSQLAVLQPLDSANFESRLSAYTVVARIMAEAGLLGLMTFLFLVRSVFMKTRMEDAKHILWISAFVALLFTQDSYILPFIPLLVSFLKLDWHRV